MPRVPDWEPVGPYGQPLVERRTRISVAEAVRHAERLLEGYVDRGNKFDSAIYVTSAEVNDPARGMEELSKRPVIPGFEFRTPSAPFARLKGRRMVGETYAGKPCPRRHDGTRYKKGNICVQCSREAYHARKAILAQRKSTSTPEE